MMGGFFPLFPPSLQQTGIRVEALRYRGESGMKPCPYWSPPVPQGRKTFMHVKSQERCTWNRVNNQGLWEAGF